MEASLFELLSLKERGKVITLDIKLQSLGQLFKIEFYELTYCWNCSI